MRYKNVEFRQPGIADSNGYTPSSNRPADIVAWQTSSNGKESCYTLCWIKEDKEGWYIETIGNRFTEYGVCEDDEALMLEADLNDVHDSDSDADIEMPKTPTNPEIEALSKQLEEDLNLDNY